MKHIFLKSAAAIILTIGFTACADELNISSIDPQTSPDYDATSLLAKQYATLGLTGQKGAAGSGDISSDEGESGFYRTTFNLMELPTDECLWAWTTDTDIPQLQGMSWTKNSPRVQWAYQRLGYDITLYNFYLQEMAGKDDAESVRSKAEVRFLRALHYWYYLDLFHKAPFKTIFDIYELPVEKGGKDLYDWIDQELTDIEPLLAPIGEYNSKTNFGRADCGAAYMLHARLALNSAVYTDGQVKDYDKAIEYSDKIINSNKYELSKTAKNGYSGYEQVFMADNDENEQAMKEIILPIRQDGLHTRSYSGSNYLVISMRIAGMPYAGTSNCWSCNFSRAALVKKFFPELETIPHSTEAAPAGVSTDEIIALDQADGSSTKQVVTAANDDRALLYAGRGGGIRKLQTDMITNFLDGVSVVKWQNIRTDGGATHDQEYPDTDIPLFRYAEAFMTKAEAMFRKGDQTGAMKVINDNIRSRANAKQLTSINEMTLLDEWSREFYMEGRRRSDLVRFGMFTTKAYIWDWKGGTANGKDVQSKYNVYPLPADDIMNNSNLTQNSGY